jgi:hypothetical protein
MATERTDPRAKVKPPGVFKTGVFELIDRISENPEVLKRAVRELKKGKSLIEVGVLSGVIEDDEERKRHLEEHWIGGRRDQQVLTRAVIRAGELCLERGVPADAYWIFAGSRLEVAVSHNDRQVTVLVVTPYPDVRTEGEAPPHSRIEMFS